MRLAAKGRVITEEVKRKMSLAKLGKSLSEDHKRKVSVALSGRVRSKEHCEALSTALLGLSKPGAIGSKHHAWKGGVTPENQRERWNRPSREWSRSVLVRDGFKCTVCGKRGKLNAHHIFLFAEHPGLRLNLNNGVAVCDPCHKEAHFFGKIRHKVRYAA
jgi:hypothetical protein